MKVIVSVFKIALIAMVSGLLCLGIFLVAQFNIRSNADVLPAKVVENTIQYLASGSSLDEVVDDSKMQDLRKYKDAFLIIYDSNKKPLKSNILLNNRVPTPPQGSFDQARFYGENKITWQPEENLRIATVLKWFSGNPGYFVVSGQDLAPFEKDIKNIEDILRLIWLAVIVPVILYEIFSQLRLSK